MIIDENGVKHPETVIEEAELQREEEKRRVDDFWNRKAQREGWARQELKQGRKPEKETKSADGYFERKSKREGWCKF